MTAQQTKGKDEDAAKRICGALERESQAKVAGAASELERIPSESKQHPDAFLVRAFLIDPSLNINKWAVTAESIPKNINTFIGKPLVLTDNYDHPGADVESLSHWLAFQETYRVGTITGIVPRKNPDTGSTAYHAIIEITDDDVKADLRNNKMPLYVSPAIAQPIDSYNASITGDFISEWTGIHLAIVSEPAFGIKKAVISDVCEGNKQGCLLQLRKAHVNLHGLNNCGFCRKGALQKYHKLMTASLLLSQQQTSTSHGSKTSPSHHTQMSQLEPMDSNGLNNTPQPQEKQAIEKVEELHTPPSTKQPVNPPSPTNTTPTNLRDLLEKYQQALHEIELRDLKINELTEAHSTVQDRIAALELRDRRKDIERIVTPDIIKDDKQRLEKIKSLVSSSIPVKEIEEIYKDMRVLVKKASINGNATRGRVPYITSNLSSQNANMTMEDEETGLTPLQKQLRVMQGGF